MAKDRIPKSGKGYFDPGFLAMQRKQREESIRRQTPISHSPKKREVKEIEVVDSQGIPEIRPLNLSEYYELPSYVRQMLQPGRSVDYAVCCMMINMLEALPNGFFGPKRSYTYPEKLYALRQIKHLSDPLFTLEVCLDHYNDPSSELMRFGNRENYHFRNLGDLMASPVLTGDSKYHIIFLKNPGAFANNYDSHMFVSEFVQAKYGGEAEELEAYLKAHKDEARFLEGDLEPYISRRLEEAGISKESYPDQVMAALGNVFRSYMEEHTNISDVQKELLAKTVRLVELYHLSKAEIEQEKLKIPDESGLIKGMASRLHPSGLLIVSNSSNAGEDIFGMRFVSYHKGTPLTKSGVSFYQRRD